MTLLHSARRALRHVGVEAYHANPMTIWERRLPRLLSDWKIETVLDVGANDGGYASAIIHGGYLGCVVSFEPLPRAWAALKQRVGRHPNWNVAPRMALSDRNGDACFHEAGNSVSSSLLPMSAAHTAAAPSSKTVNIINVPTRRLDDVLPELNAVGPMFLKIDVQGAEMLVLSGAGASLKGPIVGVQLEMSLAVLYEHQLTAADLDSFMRAQGFDCWDLLPGFRDPRTLRLLQYDGVYFRAQKP